MPVGLKSGSDKFLVELVILNQEYLKPRRDSKWFNFIIVIAQRVTGGSSDLLELQGPNEVGLVQLWVVGEQVKMNKNHH